MLFGFKKQFVTKIEDGSKTHTIRAIRKDGQVAKPGESLYLYQGLRTKNCLKIGTAICIDTYDILIEADAVYINGMLLAFDEVENFAIADGFESYSHFQRYWSRTQQLPFKGVLTRWDSFSPPSCGDTFFQHPATMFQIVEPENNANRSSATDRNDGRGRNTDLDGVIERHSLLEGNPVAVAAPKVPGRHSGHRKRDRNVPRPKGRRRLAR